MKEEMKQILVNSSMGEKETEAVYTELLNLFSVSGSFTADDVERAYDDGYQTEGEVNFDIENYR